MVLTPNYVTPRLELWRAKTDLPLLVLAIGSLPFLLLELAADRLPNSDEVLLLIVNFTVFAAFLTDYVVEFSFAKHKVQYVRHEWTSLVIVFAQALALLPALAAFGALRVIRVLRTARTAPEVPVGSQGVVPVALPGVMGSRGSRWFGGVPVGLLTEVLT